MRGGDKVEVRVLAYITGKARAMYEKLSPTGAVEDVAPEPGTMITLFADGSPYFIYETGPFRVVLCVANRYTIDTGRFVVVDVQKRTRKGK